MRKLFLASFNTKYPQGAISNEHILLAVDVQENGSFDENRREHQEKVTKLFMRTAKRCIPYYLEGTFYVHPTITEDLEDELEKEDFKNSITHTIEDVPLPSWNSDGTHSRKSREVLCDTGDGEWCVGFYDHADQKWKSNDETVTFTKDLKWYDLIPNR